MALLDFKVPIAKWLVKNGALDEAQTSPCAAKHAGGERVQLDAAASSSLRNGKARAPPRPLGPQPARPGGHAQAAARAWRVPTQAAREIFF